MVGGAAAGGMSSLLTAGNPGEDVRRRKTGRARDPFFSPAFAGSLGWSSYPNGSSCFVKSGPVTTVGYVAVGSFSGT